MRDADMDFLRLAFGELNLKSDQDAAIKLALNSIFIGDRLPELSCLLTDGHEIGGVEGWPGWLIERKDKISSEISYYAKWPKNADFHVHVEPGALELGYPDMFMSAEDFCHYVRMAIKVYLISGAANDNIARQINYQVS
ncbi:hypothetical protein QMO14_02905 [Variovorax sp. CAN2819]|uniref:hypothetical protein n=1 Tax=Variovorax sp. CAN15 TaxID=3046727 RepID=UPI0026492A2B|nr:hypothetical protein [Variovorax sp. CAN15]MDN6882544.1 hypothetical protein [Variovorax sp. CAN15]